MKKRSYLGKQMLAFLLGISLASTSIPLPAQAAVAAKTLQVGESIKFDFGVAGQVADEYIGVDAAKTYFTKGVEALNTDSTTGYTYGFLGIGKDGYLASDRADGERTDGYTMDAGMEITLLEGGTGTSVADDYVYASQTIYNLEKTDKEAAYDMGDGTMPIRFAMHVEPRSFYTVKATLANASESEPAVVNLYNERRHQIATNVELAAGETKEITFNAAITDVYFQKSEPKGTYKDTQLNVTVTGENAALAALEVTRIEHSPTMYICGDSTVCDQVGYVPSYPLHNYTGVGQGITAYFQDIMVSNQGEGGLAANDNYHFNSAAAQLQEGDYLYVQYGHNHKNDGVPGYVNCLRKYYDAAHEKGAKLLLAGPIDRQMSSQYNASANTWNSTLSGYSHAAEGYVTALIYGGTAAADVYAAAWNSTTVLADAQAAADAYIEELKANGITVAGVTDAAFVDLNAGWIEFLESVTAGNDVIGQNKYAHASFYYTYNNVYDAKDLTHINDYGASQAGYIFATEMAETYEAGIDAGEGSAAYVQAMVLEDLYQDYKTNRASVTPDRVEDETVLAGAAPNSCYPQKFVVENVSPYTTAVKNIGVKDGAFTTADVYIVSGMNSYGKVALKVYDETDTLLGTIWTTDWLDNTSMTAGSNATLHFEESDITLPSGGKCIAEVYPVSADTQEYDGESEAISKSYVAKESNGQLVSDLAFEKTVTFSAERDGNLASYVVDGDETTVWTPGGGASGYVIVDLEDVYELDKMQLYTYDWYGFAYKIEVSEDGTNYELFYENTEESGKQYTTEEADPEDVILGRYVKVTITKPSNGQWIGLADLQVFAYVKAEEPEIDEALEAAKTELHTAVTEAKSQLEKLNKAEYSEESWKALETAIAKAEALAEDATAEDVNAAKNAVADALANLKKAEPNPSEKPDTTEKPGTSETPGTSQTPGTSAENGIQTQPDVPGTDDIPGVAEDVSDTKEKPAKVKITKIQNKKKCSVVLKWKKVKGAAGYEVVMSQKKTKGYKKIGTIKKGKTVTFTKKKLKKGKKYYFKVRAYAKAKGKKVYGEYSAPKSVKIKK